MGYYDIAASRKIEFCHLNLHTLPVVHPHRCLPLTHDILYCEKGEWEIYLNDVPYLMKADDCLILHGGIEHGGHIPCAPNTELNFIHLSVTPNDLFYDDIPPALPSCLQINSLVHCQNTPEIKSIFHEIIRDFWDGSKVSDNLIEKNIPLDFWVNSPSQNKASLLCNLLLCRLSEICNRPSESIPNIVSSCVRLIEKNSHRFLSSEELAKALFVSERTLRNTFKEIYGLTPQQFQRNQKLNCAVALLKESPKFSIKEVSKSVGFTDEAYFCKVFKARFGCSPITFRNLDHSTITKTIHS